MHPHHAKPKAPSWRWKARLASFGHAGRGCLTLVRTQHNAWIHLAASLAVLGAGLLCGLQPLEWAVLALAMALVWAAEALNTAVEFLTDLVSPQHHPLAGHAKDVAAAAVLLAAIGAAVAGLCVFVPHLIR